MGMLRRVAIGVALACILGGTAYAVDEDVDNECTEREPSAAEEAVQNKLDANALNEADAEKVNELLDQADALCTEGNFKDASAALAQVNGMIGKK